MDVRDAGASAAPKDSPVPKSSPSGQHPSSKMGKKSKRQRFTRYIGKLCIFNLSDDLLLAYKMGGGEGQWAYNIRWNLNELPSLLGHFSCEAGWIFMVFVSVYMSIPWRVIATEMHALYSTVIFHYILTENKHNQMYATSYVSTNRSYTHNPLFLLVFSSTVCSISACYRISHF